MPQTQITIQSIHDFIQQKTNNSLTLSIPTHQYVADALSDDNHVEVNNKRLAYFNNY